MNKCSTCRKALLAPRRESCASRLADEKILSYALDRGGRTWRPPVRLEVSRGSRGVSRGYREVSRGSREVSRDS